MRTQKQRKTHDSIYRRNIQGYAFPALSNLSTTTRPTSFLITSAFFLQAWSASSYDTAYYAFSSTARPDATHQHHVTANPKPENAPHPRPLRPPARSHCCR